MKRNVWKILGMTLLFMLASSSAWALGPVDVEGKLLYWMGDAEIEGASDSMDGLGAEFNLWFTNKLGATVAYYPTSGSGIMEGLDLDYMNLDIKWRLISPTEHNYLAVGAGWQENELSGFGDSLDTSGFRILVEGNVGLVGILQGYGRYAYLPSLDSLDPGDLDDGSGNEMEFGVQFKAGIVSFYAGYRAHNMSFDVIGGGNVDVDNDGLVAGVGFEF